MGMAGTNYLGEMLGSLLDRPRQYLLSGKGGSIEDLCTALLADKSEVSSRQKALEVLECYQQLNDEQRASFFEFLNADMDLDADAIAKAALTYAETKSPGAYQSLVQASEPSRMALLRRLNQPQDATSILVNMRADLLRQLQTSPDLARTDADFSRMLRSWFNRGFLVLRQITWDSPASILEKIIAYEAVHEIHTWDDLRRRLHPADRRCFAFFHPAMPQEPLIFVEVALSKGVPNSIQGVLADQREILSESAADTAVFYSISNCQKGLKGISFGNSLIKQVVRDLSHELPNLKHFVTLSPIPGLRKWLADQDHQTEVLDANNLRKVAAAYLANAKSQKGLPLDPVARFHLQNGAQILAVHADADLSDAGVERSFGAMVNYAYRQEYIADNVSQLATKAKLRCQAK